MMIREKIDYAKLRGITAWAACDFCKEKCRFPGGKYRDQGEVVDCPVCNGRGVTAVIISLSQLQTLLTMMKKSVKTRAWKTKAKAKPARKRVTANS